MGGKNGNQVYVTKMILGVQNVQKCKKKILAEKFSESKMGEARENFFFCQNVPVGPKRVKNVKKKFVKNFQSPTY